jgi:hypothetical protein
MADPSMMENLLGSLSSEKQPAILIRNNSDVSSLIASNISGLLSQNSLTSEQLQLLDLLLRRWES